MASLEITVSGAAKDIERALDGVNVVQYYQVHDKVVRVMAKTVSERARWIAPRSERNPKRPDLKRSKSQLAKADWRYPLWRSITYGVRKHNRGAYAVVGPSWPKGNKAHFNTAHKKGFREVVYWGKHQAIPWPSIRNYLMQASDETKARQIGAAEAEIRKFLRANFGG